MTKPFWETKTLADMTDTEWESLCDGCGRCCMILLEDEDTDRLYETNVACKLFDARRRRCTDYANRSKRVPDCVRLTPDNAGELNWMPETCAYRRLANGQELPDWHPLLTKRKRDMIDAGVAVIGVIHEEDVDPEGIWDYVTARRPRARRRAKR
jgi:uncharacterized cysteine cluster protein YcgN (CxxCxxCC family)